MRTEIFIPVCVEFEDGKPIGARIADDAPWGRSDSTDGTKWAPAVDADGEPDDRTDEYDWQDPTTEESEAAEKFLRERLPDPRDKSPDGPGAIATPNTFTASGGGGPMSHT